MLKNVIKLAKGMLNNIFQDSFNKMLSQQLTHDRSYIWHNFLANILTLNPFPKNKFYKLKKFADNNSKFDKNRGMFSKRG